MPGIPPAGQEVPHPCQFWSIPDTTLENGDQYVLAGQGAAKDADRRNSHHYPISQQGFIRVKPFEYTQKSVEYFPG